MRVFSFGACLFVNTAQAQQHIVISLLLSSGSNSTPQLRARVKNAELTSQPGRLDGFCRVFCYNAVGWGGGGVASIAPTDFPGAAVYGAVVELTPTEIALLDEFEARK